MKYRLFGMCLLILVAVVSSTWWARRTSVRAQSPPAFTGTILYWTPTTCSSTSETQCHSTITLPDGGFADSSYVVTCSAQLVSGGSAMLGVYDKTPTSFVLYLNGSSIFISSGSVADCIAIHS
jgi:hypothetical protein